MNNKYFISQITNWKILHIFGYQWTLILFVGSFISFTDHAHWRQTNQCSYTLITILINSSRHWQNNTLMCMFFQMRFWLKLLHARAADHCVFERNELKGPSQYIIKLKEHPDTYWVATACNLWRFFKVSTHSPKTQTWTKDLQLHPGHCNCLKC